MIGLQLFRLASQVMHSVMGGMAVFSFYYAGKISDPNLVSLLILKGALWGIAAWVVLFFQCKYLEQ
jgi:hypothetical protein